MVGLLIVSHSPSIATGVKELADQMTDGRVPICAVGGTYDGRLGTSPDSIRAGFDAIAGPEGTLVLMDLGSTVISTEVALENAGFPLRLSDAPLVEGTLLAAVEALGGADLQQTAAAADRAWKLCKTSQQASQQSSPAPAAEIIITIDHPAGLHLRPAARFVETATHFVSIMRLRNLSRRDAPEVDAKSMLGMLQSGIAKGDQVRVCAAGADADAAIAAIEELVKRNFK